jgi:hypothetical protein
MSNKIQGEGDYEAARRFNKDQQDFVKRKWSRKQLVEMEDNADELDDDVGSDDITVIRRDAGWRNRSKS